MAPGKQASELLNKCLLHFVHRWRCAEDFGHARDAAAGKPTGDDEVEVGEVWVDVEGEAVHGDPAAYADAHGGDLGGGKGNRETGFGKRRGSRRGVCINRLPFALCRLPDPHTGRSLLARAFDAVCRQCADHGLLEEPHVVVQAEVKAVEVEDGVGDELPWAVVGDVAAAVGGFDGDAGAGEHVGRRGEIGRGGWTVAHGDDGVVLNEEKRADMGAVCFARGGDAFQLGDLAVVGGAVGEAAEVEDLDVASPPREREVVQSRRAHGVH